MPIEDVTLASIFESLFYLFSTGRRSYAMRVVKQAAAASGFNELAGHCDVSLAHDRETLALEAVWAGQKPEIQYSAEARQIDILVDAALVALRDGIELAVRISAPGDPLADEAVKLGNELYPKGVAAITTMVFVDEHAQVERILGCMTDPQRAQLVGALGLGRHVARLVELEPKYEAAIQAPGGKVAFAQVRDARAKGQSLMLQGVAMILGRHPSDSPADLAGRAALLGPILSQNEAIRAYLKSRRAVEDVNPETGEVQPEPPAAGGSEGAPGADAVKPPAEG